MREVLLVGVLLLTSACGSSSRPTAPTPEPTPAPTPPPEVAGQYRGFPFWTLQVLRTSDNFQTSFTCQGSMTITQQPGSATIGGFVVVTSPPCEPVSFNLTGTVQAGGAVTFTTNGPRPPQGPCPGGQNIEYTGTFTNNNRLLSARGVTRVQCPEFGEHVFTYLINGQR